MNEYLMLFFRFWCGCPRVVHPARILNASSNIQCGWSASGIFHAIEHVVWHDTGRYRAEESVVSWLLRLYSDSAPAA